MSVDAPDSPQPAFFVAGGNLAPGDPSYVERQADIDLFSALLAGEFCYVLDTRQIGKSSLMVRTAARLRAANVRVALLDLTAIGQNVTPEQWYGGLLAQTAAALDDDTLEDVWDDHARLGPAQRFFEAIRIAARHDDRPLALFVDEIDAVRSLPFPADEFFAGIRALHARRADSSDAAKVAFCLLGSATPDSLVRDVRTTPFNIGRRIEPTDFTSIEAAPLAAGLGIAGKSLLERALFWTGGHPYLTQRVCRELAEIRVGTVNAATVDRIVARLFFTDAARESEPNLTFVAARILRGGDDIAALLDLYARIRHRPRKHEPDSPHAAILRLSGLARAHGDRLRVRNRIYERVFDDAWISRSLPGAERQRQRAAFFRGFLATASVASIVLAVTSWLAIDGQLARNEARDNLVRYERQAARNKAQLEALIKYKMEADRRFKELGDQSAQFAKTEFQLRQALDDAENEIRRLRAEER